MQLQREAIKDFLPHYIDTSVSHFIGTGLFSNIKTIFYLLLGKIYRIYTVTYFGGFAAFKQARR
jgi:hypothetical protein